MAMWWTTSLLGLIPITTQVSKRREEGSDNKIQTNSQTVGTGRQNNMAGDGKFDQYNLPGLMELYVCNITMHVKHTQTTYTHAHPSLTLLTFRLVVWT